MTLAEAKAFIGSEHRHHAPPVGHRFSIGVQRDDKLVGVCVVGRPVARMTQGITAEVTRLATDGTRNACSILYAAAARAAAAMGYERIQTYTLASEPGISLRASGWTDEGECGGDEWKRSDADADLFGKTRRTDQPMEKKRRWAKVLRPHHRKTVVAVTPPTPETGHAPTAETA